MLASIPQSIFVTMTVILATLFVASVAVRLLARIRPAADFTELRLRIRTWWIMVGIFSLALFMGRGVSLAFFAFISFMALKEYLSLIPTRRADRRVLFWAYLSIPVQYYWIAIEWYGMFINCNPVYMFLFLPTRMLLVGETQGFLRSIGTLHWGLMTTVFSISHAALLLVLPREGNPAAGGAGLLLFLAVMTQANDVAQYIWGKSFGRTKVVPTVSPGKTWAGLAGGMLTSGLLSFLLAPILTPMGRVESILVGGGLSLVGFFGDITISALKRDIGVKDSGQLLPGHGGILDRVDSLTYTAPLFLHYIRYHYF